MNLLIPIVEGVVLVLLLLMSGFFSSAETALFSLSAVQVHRIRKSKPHAADRLAHLLSTPTHLLSSILVGNTVVNVTVAAVGFALSERLFPARGEAVAIPTMTVLLLLFGEVAPKRLAMLKPERLATWYAVPLTGLVAFMKPVRALLHYVTGFLHDYLRPGRKSLTEDEFLTVVEVGEEEGVLDEEERTMVAGIIRLEETQASDVMTPRVDLVGIDLEDSLVECLDVARKAPFRYLPVFRQTLDSPEGFLDVPRFLLSPDQDMEAAMVPPFFVPETIGLDTLLATLQSKNRRVVFVADEYGGTAGLVTRGDILEEIVRDVENEYGEQRPAIQKIGRAQWLVDGATSLEDINYELDMDLEAEGADRVAGWVSAQAERIPRMGEVVEGQGCRITVQRVRRNRITLVLLEKLAEEAREDEA